MLTETSAATSAKKSIQKLQRAIVDGLEDVKAQDIQVFDTEHLSALFERVVVASGNSNRQTRALAASVRDAVREAGFSKPRIEGEENGEWIIVDCGPAVVHIMQPAIRQYYTLEDIWGDKPVRMRIGKAPNKKSAVGKRTVPSTAKTSTKKTSAEKSTVEKSSSEFAAGRKAVKKTARAVPEKTTVAKRSTGVARQSRTTVSTGASSKGAAPKRVSKTSGATKIATVKKR